MLCLKCGHDNTYCPTCAQCQNHIGYVAENRGFLPQLEVLEARIKAGEATPEEAAEQLQRLEYALQYMIHQMDETGHNLVNLELDESQQATLGGFLLPVREGLETQLDTVSQLEPTGDWAKSAWDAMNDSQVQIMRGNEGVAYLTQTVLGFALQAGVDMQQLMAQPPEGEPAAAE